MMLMMPHTLMGILLERQSNGDASAHPRAITVSTLVVDPPSSPSYEN
jgi:hypothetical protein